MRAWWERFASWWSDDAARAAVLAVTCLCAALLIVDYARVPAESLQVGDVAPRTVEAPYTFRYQDVADRDRRQAEARAAVPAVYVYRSDLVASLQERISDAYAAGRTGLKAALDRAGASDPEALPDVPPEAADAFRSALGAHVPDEALAPLFRAGFPAAAETLSRDLLGYAMEGPIVADRDALPPSGHSLLLLDVGGDQRTERVLTDASGIGTPATARERLSLGLLDRSPRKADWADAAASVARASIRPNVDYDHLQTEERRERAAADVPLAAPVVKRGTTLFRHGDVLTANDLVKYEALQSSRGEHGPGFQILAIALFLLLVLASLYQFGATYLQGFSTRVRDLAAVGGLLVLVTLLARLVVLFAPGIASAVGTDAGAVWFAVPVAGAAMIVRLLVGVSWGMVFSVAAAALCGLVMDLEALYVVFYVLSAVAGAGSVDHTRERLAVLRGGVYTGLVSAATVLLIHFLQLFAAEGDLAASSAMRPMWGMAMALTGGILSAFMVLALMPLFESVGFVTDYRLLELANLNHPLLRNLMLRAPGSYHHSVIVGSLAEAASEAVGANALQARVASYFHDIGKANKPRYFIENQRGGVNRHDLLDPTHSAKMIIAHVVDGAKMARQYNLPKPIVDNIWMHHGTGLLQFFYAKAQAEAADPSKVEEADFRYPGPLPNTREAGIIMLADKVEAATRTIRTPDEHSIRHMIMTITNSVMADGQFEECPLTFREIYLIAETFVTVLVGIYHHRIEYPQTAEIARGVDTQTPVPVRNPSIITLEIPSSAARAVGGRGDLDEDVRDDPTEDYESVENLPRGR